MKNKKQSTPVSSQAPAPAPFPTLSADKQSAANKELGKSREDVVKKIKATAHAAGLTSFILGFESDDLVTTHMENMRTSSASRIVITLFQQICDFEASQQLLSEEYRVQMVALKNEFTALIGAHNRKCEEIRSRGAGKVKAS